MPVVQSASIILLKKIKWGNNTVGYVFVNPETGKPYYDLKRAFKAIKEKKEKVNP